MKTLTFTLILLFTSILFIYCANAQERDMEWHPDLTNDWTPVDDSVATGTYEEPPSDAIILFDGTKYVEHADKMTIGLQGSRRLCKFSKYLGERVIG